MSVVSGGLQSGGGAAVLLLPGATGTTLTLSSTSTAAKFVSTAASGSSAFEVAGGARYGLNASANSYIALTGNGIELNYQGTTIQNGTDATGPRGRMGISTTFNPYVSAATTNTAGASSSTAGPNDLVTYSLPANSLNSGARGVRITAWGTATNNANAKTLTLNFGATALATIALTINQANDWRFTAEVYRTAAATQIANAQGIQFGTVSQYVVTSTTPAETLSGAITIKCTATNEVQQLGLLVEYLPN